MRLGAEERLRPRADAGRLRLGYRQLMTILRAGDIQGARTGQGAPWFARLGAWLGSRPAPDALDALIAAGCFAGFTLPVLLVPAWGAGPAWAIAALAALAAVPLIARRRQPVRVAVVLTCVYVAAALAGVQFTPFVSCAGPNLAVAIFTVADRCSRRVSVPVAAVASIVTWAVLAPAIHLHPSVDQDAVQAAVMIPAWLAGDIVRTRRQYRRSLAQEGLRQEAEREARIRAEERLALSRDVHDVVSHSLSMIAVQSGAARLVLAERPAEARAVLAAIETASRSALEEVRVLLRQIRAPGPAGGGRQQVSPTWPAGRPDAGQRARTQLPLPRAARGLPARGGGVGLPDRAGSADQREPARAGCAGDAGGDPDRGGGDDFGDR